MFTGRLYRYRPFKDEDIARTERTILYNEIYYASPEQFDDPFDCRIEGLSFSEESIVSYMVRILSHLFPADFIRKGVERNLHKYRAKSNSVINGLKSDVLDNYSVLCLSALNDNILMYSHYANGHRGICLEFTITPEDIFNPEKVNYIEDYPRLRFSTEQEDLRKLAEAILLTKANLWEYEQEYRSVAQWKPGVQEFRPECLTGIIFGCKASNDAKRQIVGMVKRRAHPISLYEAIPKRDRFGLDIVPMKEGA